MGVPFVPVAHPFEGCQPDPAGLAASRARTRDFWRYYFAGQALAGLCADPAPLALALCGTTDEQPQAVAERAVAIADALLAKLEGEEGT